MLHDLVRAQPTARARLLLLGDLRALLRRCEAEPWWVGDEPGADAAAREMQRSGRRSKRSQKRRGGRPDGADREGLAPVAEAAAADDRDGSAPPMPLPLNLRRVGSMDALPAPSGEKLGICTSNSMSPRSADRNVSSDATAVRQSCVVPLVVLRHHPPPLQQQQHEGQQGQGHSSHTCVDGDAPAPSPSLPRLSASFAGASLLVPTDASEMCTPTTPGDPSAGDVRRACGGGGGANLSRHMTPLGPQRRRPLPAGTAGTYDAAGTPIRLANMARPPAPLDASGVPRLSTVSDWSGGGGGGGPPAAAAEEEVVECPATPALLQLLGANHGSFNRGGTAPAAVAAPSAAAPSTARASWQPLSLSAAEGACDGAPASSSGAADAADAASCSRSDRSDKSLSESSRSAGSGSEFERQCAAVLLRTRHRSSLPPSVNAESQRQRRSTKLAPSAAAHSDGGDEDEERLGLRWAADEDELAFQRYISCVMANDPRWIEEFINADDSSDEDVVALWKSRQRQHPHHHSQEEDDEGNRGGGRTPRLPSGRRCSSLAAVSMKAGATQEANGPLPLDTAAANELIDRLVTTANPSAVLEAHRRPCPHCELLPSQALPLVFANAMRGFNARRRRRHRKPSRDQEQEQDDDDNNSNDGGGGDGDGGDGGDGDDAGAQREPYTGAVPRTEVERLLSPQVPMNLLKALDAEMWRAFASEVLRDHGTTVEEKRAALVRRFEGHLSQPAWKRVEANITSAAAEAKAHGNAQVLQAKKKLAATLAENASCENYLSELRLRLSAHGSEFEGNRLASLLDLQNTLAEREEELARELCRVSELEEEHAYLGDDLEEGEHASSVLQAALGDLSEAQRLVHAQLRVTSPERAAGVMHEHTKGGTGEAQLDAALELDDVQDAFGPCCRHCGHVEGATRFCGVTGRPHPTQPAHSLLRDVARSARSAVLRPPRTGVQPLGPGGTDSRSGSRSQSLRLGASGSTSTSRAPTPPGARGGPAAAAPAAISSPSWRARLKSVEVDNCAGHRQDALGAGAPGGDCCSKHNGGSCEGAASAQKLHQALNRAKRASAIGLVTFLEDAADAHGATVDGAAANGRHDLETLRLFAGRAASILLDSEDDDDNDHKRDGAKPTSAGSTITPLSRRAQESTKHTGEDRLPSPAAVSATSSESSSEPSSDGAGDVGASSASDAAFDRRRAARLLARRKRKAAAAAGTPTVDAAPKDGGGGKACRHRRRHHQRRCHLQHNDSDPQRLPASSVTDLAFPSAPTESSHHIPQLSPRAHGRGGAAVLDEVRRHLADATKEKEEGKDEEREHRNENTAPGKDATEAALRIIEAELARIAQQLVALQQRFMRSTMLVDVSDARESAAELQLCFAELEELQAFLSLPSKKLPEDEEAGAPVAGPTGGRTDEIGERQQQLCEMFSAAAAGLAASLSTLRGGGGGGGGRNGQKMRGGEEKGKTTRRDHHPGPGAETGDAPATAATVATAEGRRFLELVSQQATLRAEIGRLKDVLRFAHIPAKELLLRASEQEAEGDALSEKLRRLQAERSLEHELPEQASAIAAESLLPFNASGREQRP